MNGSGFQSLRKAMGLSASQCGQALGTRERTVNSWESGRLRIRPGPASEMEALHQHWLRRMEALAEETMARARALTQEKQPTEVDNERETTRPATLRHLRKEMGLDQKPLAEAFGLQPRSYARWELGIFPANPVIATRLEMLHAFWSERVLEERHRLVRLSDEILADVRERNVADGVTVFNTAPMEDDAA